jgi:hypothetical protein
MKRAPRSLQHHVLYRKYNGQDSEISALLGKCGISLVIKGMISSIANMSSDILSLDARFRKSGARRETITYLPIVFLSL